MSDIYTLNDADRFNNILQMLMRCCVKVKKKILPMFTTYLGYTSVDQFLSTEKAHLLKMPVASLQKNQDILYPATGILTNIEQWDMSLLNCVYTHIQRKLIINDFKNPIDPIIQQYKAQVLATTVGKENKEKLYPQFGKPTDVNKWNMSLCSCMFSVLSPKPQTLHVRIAESLNSLREMRNSLCHTETPDMESLVYEEHLTVLKDFINSGLTYIGDVAFETEIKEDMGDIENGRMRCFILADHKHLERSYANDRDINQKLDSIVKEIQKLSQKDQELTLMVFFSKVKDDEKNLLYSLFADICTQLVEKHAPEIVGDIDPNLKELIILSVFQAWKILNNPYEGMRVLGAKRACLKIKLRFDNAVRMWKFIKTYLSGTLDSFFEKIQELLRTRVEFENLEMTVVVPDVIAVFIKSGEAQEIDPISMMCVMELLNQRLISLDEKQQHDRENADIRTGKMEFDKPGVTSLKKKEQVLDEPKTLLEEFYLNESGLQIMTTLKPKPSEKFFEEITFDEAGKKVKTSIQEEIEKPIEECTVEEAAKRVKTTIQEETEKPIGEYTVHDTGEKVKTTILEETEKHIEEYTADEAGKTVKPTIQEETEKPIEKYTVHEAGEMVKKTIQEETEKHIEEYTTGEAKEKVMASIFKETKMPIEGVTIDESEQKVKSLAPVEPELSMAIFSTNVSEPKKELPTYYCEPCLQNEIKVQYVAKCRDCNEMLCADCARVHRVSKMSRNHIMIGKQPDDFTSLKLTPDTSIQPKSTSDHKVCKLSNMLPLPGNRLLLVDFNNGKFKMVDLRTNSLMSQVSVQYDPMGMCVLPGDRVAVCLPSTDITVIQFLGALEQVTFEESIKVGGYCLGIGYYNDRLIVSFRGGKVEVMDMSGRVMKKIDSVDSGQSVFRFPMNLRVVSEGQDAVVYVSDFQKDTITKLDMDLNILQIFQDPALRGPNDITAVGKQLLICGWYTNNIMCLDLPSGKMTELLGMKDRILHPENVCYSQQQNRLYVKCQSGTRVRVYKPSLFSPGHMTNRLERRRRS